MSEYFGYDVLLKIGGTTVAQVRDLEGPGLTLNTVNVTSRDSGKSQKRIAGEKEGGRITFDIVYDPAAPTHVGGSGGVPFPLLQGSRARFSLVLPDVAQTTIAFTALVAAFKPKAPIEGALTADLELQVTSSITISPALTTTPILVTVGDSITAGTGASDAAHRWANIVAEAMGVQLVNNGVGGTILQNTAQNSVATIGAAADDNLRDAYVGRILDYAPMYVVISYGVNDVRLNDAAITAANFQNDLEEIVDALIAGGVDADNIVLCSPSWMHPDYYDWYPPFDGATNQRFADFIAAAAVVAATRSTRFADIYGAMASGGGLSLMADLVHPADAGHAVTAATVLAALLA